MANESVFKYGTAVTLTSAGASVSTLQLSAAAGTTYTQSDTADYPDAVFTLDVGTFGSAPVSGSVVDLYIRPLDVDSTTDTPAPPTGASTAAYKGQWIGAFIMTAATTGVYRCVGYDIPRAGEAYIYNGTTQTLANSGNWTLKMTPRANGPA